MRDMPVFTTEFGIASLTLREIPYKQTAYIRVQVFSNLDRLLAECISFCKACGADHIFATGVELFGGYPVSTEIWQMRCSVNRIPDTDAALFPVQRETLEIWRCHYNNRMRFVPNAATMTLADAQKLLDEGSGYFVHRGNKLLGIGKAYGGTIEAVASLIPGMGREVVSALAHALTEDTVMVEVASVNEPAIKLYEKLGFMRSCVISTWYRIL